MDRLVPAIKPMGMMFDDAIYQQCQIPDDYCLAEISDFQGLLPKAHSIGVPIFEITDEEIGERGPVLEQMVGKRNDFNGMFSTIADKIISLADYA